MVKGIKWSCLLEYYHSPVGQIGIFSYCPAGEQFKTILGHVILL
jgi:hypothetical protein